jgi:hypothetical protein
VRPWHLVRNAVLLGVNTSGLSCFEDISSIYRDDSFGLQQKQRISHAKNGGQSPQSWRLVGISLVRLASHDGTTPHSGQFDMLACGSVIPPLHSTYVMFVRHLPL